MLSKDELSARIKREENNITFYVIFFDSFIEKGLTSRELEKRIDFHLDRLIDLYKQRNKG